MQGELLFPPRGFEDLIGILQKCRHRKDLQQARLLHGYMCEQELEFHPILGNHLVPTLVECGSLCDAQQVFARLPQRNVHSWTSLISGYIQCGDFQLAFQSYNAMQHNDFVLPDRCTFLTLLKLCGKLKDAERGHDIHLEIIHRGLDMDAIFGSPVVGNTLVDMYGKCGLLEEAQNVFNQLPVRNTVSWNALIAGYAEGGLHEEVGSCFEQMQRGSVTPDLVTFVLCLKAYGSLGMLESGQKMHSELIKRKLERELCVANTLVDVYCKCKLLEDAQVVFDGLPARSAVSWNALIAGYAESGYAEHVCTYLKQMQLEGLPADAVTFVFCLKACTAVKMVREIHVEITKRALEQELSVGNTLVDVYAKHGLLAEAFQVFSGISTRSAVSWNTMISGYTEQGLDKEVLRCFKRMQLEGVPADTITYVLCLKACGIVGALETGREIHGDIRNANLERDLHIGSMLLEMYGKCGSLVEGCEVFDKMPVRDVVLWTALIKAYGENHESNMAVQCFLDMLQEGVKPDSITFTCLLAACSHASLVSKGLEYLKLMQEVYDIKPTLDHCAYMVDLLARSGHIAEAMRLVAPMQFYSSSVIPMIFLRACKIYGETELGHWCFQQIIEINQEDAAAYMLLAEVYANAGRWNDAIRVEEMRKHVGANKNRGSAFIEVSKRLYDFCVGGSRHIHVLEALDVFSEVRHDEYVPNLDFVSGHTSAWEMKTNLSYG